MKWALLLTESTTFITASHLWASGSSTIKSLLMVSVRSMLGLDMHEGLWEEVVLEIGAQMDCQLKAGIISK
jgi:hypothetical protein